MESFSTFCAFGALYASFRQEPFEDLRGDQEHQRSGMKRRWNGSPVRRGRRRLGKRLDPALKSWMDNVIIPALVREYLAEIEKRNRLATTGGSEVTSDKDGIEP